MPKINYNSPRFQKLNTKIRYDLCPRFQKKSRKSFERTIKKTLTVERENHFRDVKKKVLIHHGGKVHPLGEPCKFCDKVKREFERSWQKDEN